MERESERERERARAHTHTHTHKHTHTNMAQDHLVMRRRSKRLVGTEGDFPRPHVWNKDKKLLRVIFASTCLGKKNEGYFPRQPVWEKFFKVSALAYFL